MSTVLYGSEAWTCTEKEYSKLNVFHTKRLRAILGKNRDEISNEKLFKLTKVHPFEMYVRKVRLKWNDHLMDDGWMVDGSKTTKESFVWSFRRQLRSQKKKSDIVVFRRI